MGSTGIVRDPIFQEHIKTYEQHPENHHRLEVIDEVLEASGLLGDLVSVPLRKATEDEIAFNHSRSYIAKVADTANYPMRSLDPDTYTTERSYEAAMYAAGSLMELVKRVHKGKLDNGYAIVRPPGHHAWSNRSAGFCLFNNIAIAAAYARKLGYKRVAVIDFDLHHGNGTHYSFEDRPDILYVSTHQHPFYPGTGAFTEIGTGEGKGFSVNVPLAPGQGDAEYLKIYREALLPIVDEYKPQFILVSAGYDTHLLDLIGSMRMTGNGFGMLMSEIMAVARKHAKGKVVVTLEGGYHLEASARGLVRTLEAMMGRFQPSADPLPAAHPDTDRYIQRIREVLGDYWQVLR